MSADIETVAQLQQVFGSRVTRHQRAVEAVSRWLGRPSTLYVLLGAVATWIAYDALAARQGWPVFDRPPFAWLQGVLTLYAAIVATTVLTAQNRQNAENEKRAHLELQVSLLAEQKATKLISLLEELRHDLPGVRDRSDPEAEAMQKRPDAREVLSALESTMETPTSGGAGDPQRETGPART